ncbi:hypothetical protein Kpho02_50600 [Kitasatospora phosalacinea]|uniref:Uncharacterized protein n=1 Tax=Kitasatospora phosalacinea TaxID=2065 RepID=A0A9W6QCA4_9ACTN|nr:hypothetical protein Kpho02_50600 [Kitasatospora phosalacinea]
MTVAVCRRSPLPADHFVLSGLWFHSRSGPKVAVVKVSLPVGGLTVREESRPGRTPDAAPAPLCGSASP